jgi:hypothetical protein
MTYRTIVAICLGLWTATLGFADTGWARPAKSAHRKQLRKEFRSLMKHNRSLRATYKEQKRNYEVRAKLVTAAVTTAFATVSWSMLAASIAQKNGEAASWSGPAAPAGTGMAVWAWKNYRNARHEAMKATARDALLSGVRGCLRRSLFVRPPTEPLPGWIPA